MKDIELKLIEKLKNIKLVVLDFDGVLTNNKVLVAEDGTEFVTCDRSDGLGVSLLKKLTDIDVIVLSKEKNKVVGARCKKLGIECFTGVEEKYPLLQKILSQKQLSFENTAYLGNDINDMQCIKSSGVGVVVADAHIDVKSAADLILTKNGGEGAVREFCDILICVNQNGEQDL